MSRRRPGALAGDVPGALAGALAGSLSRVLAGALPRVMGVVRRALAHRTPQARSAGARGVRDDAGAAAVARMPGVEAVAAAPAGTFRQPDPTTCGSSCLVMARMLIDPPFAAPLLADPALFAPLVLRVHRWTNGAALRGAIQLPWPRALGTQPWALARAARLIEAAAQTAGDRQPDIPADTRSAAGTPGWRVVIVDPADPGAAFDLLHESVRTGRSVPVLTGDAWCPRHVMLAARCDTAPGDDLCGDPAVIVYEPSTGTFVPLTRGESARGQIRAGGWPQLWALVVPRG